MEVWQAMESLISNGGVTQLGLSNCYSLEELEALYNAASVKPTVLQNRFYDETNYDREIRAFCREHGISYQSFWTLTANRHLLGHDDIKALATRYERTPAQILFRYLTPERSHSANRDPLGATYARGSGHLRLQTNRCRTRMP